MIRLNIKYKDKLETKSFITVNDLANFLKTKFSHYLLNDNAWLVKANTIFNLGVGEKFDLFTDYRISVNGKSRAGNIMLGGK